MSDTNITDAARATVLSWGGDWRRLREGATFVTVGRTATTWENGHLVGCERQQLTVFTNGEILFYYRDDTALLQGITGGSWERLKDTDSILTVVGQPARVDIVEY